ncbi:MAG: CHAD domain-containing protein [Acidimicrobiales bacterium]
MPARVDDLARQFLGRGVSNLLRLDRDVRRGLDVEAVHQMRVNVRHLRSELRVVATAMRAKDLARLDADLAWLGGSLSRLRDADVLAALLEGPGFPRAAAVDARLARNRAREARRVARVLDSSRYELVVARLARAALRPPLRGRGSRSAIDVLGPGLTREIRRLGAAHDALGESPGPDELHALRILAKRCRYTCELAISIVPGSKRAAADLERVQTVLGDLHDHVVAHAFVASCAPHTSLFEPIPRDPEVDAVLAHLDATTSDLHDQWRAPLDAARASLAKVSERLQTSSSGPDVPVA